MSTPTAVRRGFSLIELVIVVVIIGIIAAIAIPRMSRGAAGAQDAALQQNLATLRNGIDMFYTEHANLYPNLATISNELTMYSKEDRSTNATTTGGFIFGPYVRTIPALPVGVNKGLTTFTATLGGTFGWVYVAGTGAVSANCPNTELDARGVQYNSY